MEFIIYAFVVSALSKLIMGVEWGCIVYQTQRRFVAVRAFLHLPFRSPPWHALILQTHLLRHHLRTRKFTRKNVPCVLIHK